MVHLRRCLHRFNGPQAEVGTGRTLAYSSAVGAELGSSEQGARKVTVKLVLLRRHSYGVAGLSMFGLSTDT